MSLTTWEAEALQEHGRRLLIELDAARRERHRSNTRVLQLEDDLRLLTKKLRQARLPNVVAVESVESVEA